MTVLNLGSINIDIVFAVPHIPAPGETLSSTGREVFLGGKGTNMSVAIARAGGTVRHIGAVGPDGGWTVERLRAAGVDIGFIAELEEVTGQALIAVDADGENTIILYPGANRALRHDAVMAALAEAGPGDRLLLQNETNLQAEAAREAKALGLAVTYAAAPFDADAVKAVLPTLDMLFLNRVEAEQLTQATGQAPADLGVRDVVITLGADGCDWIGPGGVQHFDAVPVEPVDTTGAGDTFTGYTLAALERGLSMPAALELAGRAGALMVTRHGTSDVIPTLDEVRAFAG
ncbi:ribokinase [Oceanicola granulosus HTCC2516]|uniref:Ribokinase n=1 Tax=Oceanicola granulosus (strain ATCC BAA-861 / DSM 15982 / KCTC 12143 / HTCC2516) TaxID=314256 RepID=Q2CJT0_OCEGH|nr:ribokinase [Oceanicola granulosus]EAR53059.1 ribokinase [Oceanicola granulosus HTCC2516]